MSSSQFHSSVVDQDELHARRKLEQKRRFQQTQGKAPTDVDSLMQSMFTDLKLPTRVTTTETKKAQASTNEMLDFSAGATDSSVKASATAADWSKITFDDELNRIFQKEEVPAKHSEEQKFVYPSWCSQPTASLPLVYQQVLEASCVANAIQTSVLYPILLLSGLRQDQLSQIWAQVNLTEPGTLVKEELFMALALIALAQNSDGRLTPLDRLYHLTEIPTPHFQIQSTPPPVVYQQEDFADFAAFSTFEHSEQLDNGSLLDLDAQSLTSLDLPNPSHSLQDTSDPPSKLALEGSLELTQFSFFSDEPSPAASHASVWLRCFEQCHAILTQANEIFSSIESPSLCTEILHQTRARDYVAHLQEMFHMQKRIQTAALREPTATSQQLQTLWKQIVVLWTNLQSFFSTAHLHLLNDDEIDYSSYLSPADSYCSICLLSTAALDETFPSFNRACLTFAGRSYHAPCANFYLNLIDGILPSLRRLS